MSWVANSQYTSFQASAISGVTASPSTSPTAAEQVMTDDGVLLGPDAQRDVFVGNAFHDPVERRRGGVDQLHGVGHDGRGQRPGLFSGGLVALVEDPQQLGVLGEHPWIEPGGDLLGMGGDDARGGGDDSGGPIRQQ